MNILVLNGSPRTNGHTAEMVNAFCESVKEEHQVTVFDVTRMNIHGCMACEYCHTKEKGVCIQKDDMQKIYPVLQEAEMLVIASPIYYYSYSGQMQCTLNRIYALDKPANLKKTALFLSAGDENAFEGAIFAYKGNFPGYLKTEDMGIYTTHGKENPSEALLNSIRQMASSL